jgi:viologen exporter family transport system permease protein
MSVEASRGSHMAPPPPEVGRARSLLDFYLTSTRTSIIRNFQYRVANYFYMIGMLAEPIIYMVVWSTVARAQGGAVNGFTPGDFAAYYIVWTLVRQMNIALTPAAWEWRIREGQLSGYLLRPIHPINYDLADIGGWKFAVIVMWLPIAAVLTLIFRPTLHPRLVDVAVFAVAIWGAYVIRSLALWVLGMVTFWTTRVAAIFEMYFAAELTLSGRLVPLRLMPKWVQHVANFLPFKWTFGYPIESMVGRLSLGQLLGGLGAQAVWIAAGSGLVMLVWRRAIRRFTSAGN